MSPQTHDPAEMVNLSRYPITDLTRAAGAALAHASRKEYRQTGLCLLPDFILPSALSGLVAEVNDRTEDAYFCQSTHNAYLTADDPELATNDITRRQEHTFVGSISYDHIDRKSRLNTLYQWDALKNFIGFILDKEPFYRFADPFGACSVNVFVDGGQHGWHFDESEFTVTLMLQAPDKGGAFEYIPQIRGLDNERALVASALEGKRDGVVELPFTAGTLLIFGGKQTLHRVTRVEGSRPRLVPVLCYSETPNLQNSERVRKLFWGRSGPDDKRVDEVAA